MFVFTAAVFLKIELENDDPNPDGKMSPVHIKAVMRNLENNFRVANKQIREVPSVAELLKVIEMKEREITCIQWIDHFLACLVACPSVESLEDLEKLCEDEALSRLSNLAFKTEDFTEQFQLKDRMFRVRMHQYDREVCMRKLTCKGQELSVAEHKLMENMAYEEDTYGEILRPSPNVNMYLEVQYQYTIMCPNC